MRFSAGKFGTAAGKFSGIATAPGFGRPTDRQKLPCFAGAGGGTGAGGLKKILFR